MSDIHTWNQEVAEGRKVVAHTEPSKEGGPVVEKSQITTIRRQEEWPDLYIMTRYTRIEAPNLTQSWCQRETNQDVLPQH